MQLAQFIANRLNGLGFPSKVVNANKVEITRPNASVIQLEITEDWIEAYAKYIKLKNIKFDATTRVYTYRNCVVMALLKLSPAPPFVEDLVFTDSKRNKVSVLVASNNYTFAFFSSDGYTDPFERLVKPKLTRELAKTIRVSSILICPYVATYKHAGKLVPPNLQDLAVSAINRTLFKITVELDEPYVIYKNKGFRTLRDYTLELKDHYIPRASYDEKVVNYYKLAKSSVYPSQCFLSYYHVLEYHFLTVSEQLIHHRLTSILNQPEFKTSTSNLDRVVAAVRGQDNKSDETEMLRAVIDRYVSEGDLEEFVREHEKKIGSLPFTDRKKKLFGEGNYTLALGQGHTISNAARILKFIRNAIVHSSDRYRREERHVPLSDTENSIDEYLPLIKFIAEKVIYGAAH